MRFWAEGGLHSGSNLVFIFGWPQHSFYLLVSILYEIKAPFADTV